VIFPGLLSAAHPGPRKVLMVRVLEIGVEAPPRIAAASDPPRLNYGCATATLGRANVLPPSRIMHFTPPPSHYMLSLTVLFDDG